MLMCGFPFHQVLTQTVLTLHTDSTFQTIAGFGGFGAKKVWWDPPPHYDQTYLDQVIDTLGCTFIRTQIYWDAEPVNDNADPQVTDWSKFRFGSDTDNGKQFAFIRDLGAKGARLLATVWTPPIWMKGLDEFHGTLWGNPVRRRPSDADLDEQCWWCGGSGGCNQVGGWLKPEYYAEFAEYLVAYVKKVKEQTGVDVWGINIQNEPYFPNPFESCVVIPEEYAEVLKIVGARFAEEGITARLFGPEHMGEVSWGINTEYIREILEEETVKPYLSFYAVHSYVDGVAPDYGSAEGWTALYEKTVLGLGKELWMTETSDFSKEGYDLAFSMARSLYLALRFGHISGWVYWAMADYVIKNNVLTPLGRAFQQYYRFLPPGTVMIGASSNDPDLLVVAGKTGEDLSVIVINNSAENKTVNLTGGAIPDQYFAYRTSATESFKRLPNASLTGIPMKANSITSLTSRRITTGTVGHPSDPEIGMFPNPASQLLLITNARGGYLTLHDLQGRCLLAQSLPENRESLDISGMHPGLYMATITCNGRTFSQKLAILKP